MNISELFQLKKRGRSEFFGSFSAKKETIAANGGASYTKIPSRSPVAGFWFTRSQTAKPYIVQSTAQSREEAARGAEEPLPPVLVIECHKY